MTLENSKGYGLKERVQSLQDVSRSRLNGPTPHQVRMHAATVKRAPAAPGCVSHRDMQQTQCVTTVLPQMSSGEHKKNS